MKTELTLASISQKLNQQRTSNFHIMFFVTCGSKNVIFSERVSL